MNIPKIPGLTEDQVLTLAVCRTYKQHVATIEGYKAGKCHFCDPLDEKVNKVIQVSGAWRMWVNQFALKHTSPHLIMAPKQHVGPHDQITPADFSDMGKLFAWAQREFSIKGGGFVMRFGPPALNAGSVLHLHANLIVPDLTGNVRVTLSKEPEEFAEQIARMFVFEKLRQGVPMTDLDDQERALIEGRI